MYGDFNARVGEKLDFIEGIDEVCRRFSIDKTKNKHGDALLEICTGLKMALINGRITPEKDDFTSFNRFGMSVIDYWITGYESVCTVETCEVIPVADYINKIGLETGPKLSDHSLIFIQIKLCADLKEEESDISTTDDENTGNNVYEKPIKYRIREIPPQFMQSENVVREFEGLIDDLLKAKLSQQEVDLFVAPTVRR